MRIDQLSLRNFRCHESLVIEVPEDKRIVMVIGANADGKSTLADAISFAFTGRCRGVDGSGQGLNDLVRDAVQHQPQAPFGVGVHWRNGDGEHMTERGRGQGPKWGGQAAISKALGADPTYVRACLLYSALIDSTPAAQWGLLEELLDLRVPPEALAFLGQHAPKHPLAFHEVAQLEARFRAERQALGRPGPLGAPPEPPEGLPGDFTAKDGAEAADALESRLEALREQERALTEQAAAAGGSLEALMEHAAELGREIAAAEEVVKLTPTPEDAQARRAAALAAGKPVQQEIDTFEAGLFDLSSEIAEKTAKLEAVSVQIGRPSGATLPKVGDRCSGCGRKHTKATRAFLEQREVPPGADLDGLRKERDTLKATVADLIATRQDGQNALTEARGRLNGIRQEAQTVLQAIADEQASRAEAERRAERGKNKLRELQIRMEKATTATGPDPEELAGVQARIKTGEGRLRALRDWLSLMRRHQQAAEEAATVTERRTWLDRTVEALGPKGVRREIAASAAGAFIASVQEMLEPFGYGLEVGPDFDLRVSGRPLALLSDSERIRVGLGIQYAVAKASGLNFLVLDNADWLDSAGRRILAGVLEAAGGEMDQVWVLQTVKGPKDQATIPDTDGTPWQYVVLP